MTFTKKAFVAAAVLSFTAMSAAAPSAYAQFAPPNKKQDDGGQNPDDGKKGGGQGQGKGEGKRERGRDGGRENGGGKEGGARFDKGAGNQPDKGQRNFERKDAAPVQPKIQNAPNFPKAETKQPPLPTQKLDRNINVPTGNPNKGDGGNPQRPNDNRLPRDAGAPPTKIDRRDIVEPSQQKKNTYDGPRRFDPQGRGKDDRRQGRDEKPNVINNPPPNTAPPGGGNFGNRADPGRPVAGGDPRRQFDEIRQGRKQRVEAGGKRVVIEEPGNRTIFKQNNRVVIQHDENERLRRIAPNARFERGKGGSNLSIIDRPGNVRIYSETDERGQLIRRYRRDGDGRETNIIDNRRRDRKGKNVIKGIGIGLGVVAGAAILNSLVDVPPPRVRIPRDRYIVDYERASDDELYDTLSAPPVDEFQDRYTLDEIRATPRLRDRMRRVDLDDINFEFGSFEVTPDQYRKLERIGRVMNRIIQRNPNEVFLIEGYTDAVGSREDNLTLSDRRAESVAVVLTEEFNVPFENLTTQGYGEDYLKINTQQAERVNRRVAVRRITPLMSSNDIRSNEFRKSSLERRYRDEGPDDRRFDDRAADRVPDDDQDGPPPGGPYEYRPYQGNGRD